MTNQQATPKTDTGEQAFAAGDLGRVQGLLFGDQFDAINERIDSLEALLLDSVNAVRSELRKEIATTKRKIDRSKEQIDKRLDSKIAKEATSRKTALADLATVASSDSEELKSDLVKTSAAFEKSLDALKKATDKAIASSRSSLESQLRSTEESLSTSKVDRNTLAELLSQTASELTVSEEKSGPKRIRRAA